MNMINYFKRTIAVLLVSFLTSTVANAQHFTDFEFYGTVSESVRRTMQNNANAVFRAIHEAHFNNRQNITLSPNNATPEAIERIRDLWSGSSFYCVETRLTRPITEIPNGGLEVRGIPVFFVEGGTPEEQSLELVLEFAPNGIITDLSIALQQHEVQNFFENASDVTDLRRRQLILGFVENFRTAFNRKDINFIEQVFSNDALIIVGRVLERRGDSPNPLGVDVVYTRLSKEEYIRRLRNVFRNNRWINVRFENIGVMRHSGNTNVYGVTLRQYWNAERYSDVGWLFLMIDFTDENNPLIWVRAWNSQDTPSNARIGLDNFIIN